MPYVKCKYCEEDDDLCPEDKYIAGDFKRVEWDGEILTLGKRKILSHAAYEREFREHGGYMGGFNDIYYLEIDGTVYLEKESEDGEDNE